MSLFDWCVIVFYICAMIGLSIWIGKKQASQEDYFVGGRNLPWWAVGLSTMATQTSAISFISIPAFVALKSDGGLTWLQYELGVPLAMIFLMAFLIPFFRNLRLVSVYEYLEGRFNPTVRYTVSLIFLISRGLGTGIGVYASAIVLAVCLGIPLWSTILIIGIVTIIYDTIGGISAVVYSDVVQMLVLISGLIACIVLAAGLVGGLDDIWNHFPVSRRDALDMSTGIGDGGRVPFWAFFIGGIFLYASYYGTDQSQVQRELSAKTTADTKKSLVLNGLARFPLTALYCALGMTMWLVYHRYPHFAQSIPYDKPDYLVPQFILFFLPPGLRGLLFAALLAAAMSSLDSALNSLSASTMRDFIGPSLKDRSRLLFYSKMTTISWGIVITGFAFAVGSISETVIEGINKIGSLFYGPILATFILGVLSERTTPGGVLSGIVAGVVCNLTLWQFFEDIHWMWWNISGFLMAVLVGRAGSPFIKLSTLKDIRRYVLRGSDFIAKERSWLGSYILLVVYFFMMILIMIWLS
jgi:SSS family solute:Na+ symporter